MIMHKTKRIYGCNNNVSLRTTFLECKSDKRPYHLLLSELIILCIFLSQLKIHKLLPSTPKVANLIYAEHLFKLLIDRKNIRNLIKNCF